MEKYKSSEFKLNEFPDPTNFHDMSVVNMKFYNDNIRVRFILAKYMDDFEILEDDEHFAILEVVYNGVSITNMNLEGLVDFRGSTVYELKEKNGIVSLNLHNHLYDFYYYMEFTCEGYNWKVNDIVTVEEYFEYSNSLIYNIDKIIEIQNVDIPRWASFEN